MFLNSPIVEILTTSKSTLSLMLSHVPLCPTILSMEYSVTGVPPSAEGACHVILMVFLSMISAMGLSGTPGLSIYRKIMIKFIIIEANCNI